MSEQETILPPDWNPKDAADAVLAGLTNICEPRVKGAHDSDFLIVRARWGHRIASSLPAGRAAVERSPFRSCPRRAS
jgi:hypothetical protein